VSQGRTRQEATENIKEAIALYLETLADEGEPVPEGNREAVLTAVGTTAGALINPSAGSISVDDFLQALRG
jgi:hypothetical protein